MQLFVSNVQGLTHLPGPMPVILLTHFASSLSYIRTHQVFTGFCFFPVWSLTVSQPTFLRGYIMLTCQIIGTEFNRRDEGRGGGQWTVSSTTNIFTKGKGSSAEPSRLEDDITKQSDSRVLAFVFSSRLSIRNSMFGSLDSLVWKKNPFILHQGIINMCPVFCLRFKGKQMCDEFIVGSSFSSPVENGKVCLPDSLSVFTPMVVNVSRIGCTPQVSIWSFSGWILLFWWF